MLHIVIYCICFRTNSVLTTDSDFHMAFVGVHVHIPYGYEFWDILCPTDFYLHVLVEYIYVLQYFEDVGTNLVYKDRLSMTHFFLNSFMSRAHLDAS